MVYRALICFYESLSLWLEICVSFTASYNKGKVEVSVVWASITVPVDFSICGGNATFCLLHIHSRIAISFPLYPTRHSPVLFGRHRTFIALCVLYVGVSGDRVWLCVCAFGTMLYPCPVHLALFCSFKRCKGLPLDCDVSISFSLQDE